MNKILIALKRKLDDIVAYEKMDAETQRNVLKEELQYYVLDFIYHHPRYSDWIMYGGSALRICHGLNRMSIDLDFEVDRAITEKFLGELKKEIESYFANSYGAGPDFLSIKTTRDRGLTLKFQMSEEISIGHPSKQVHVKIDFNNFSAPKTVIERIPVNHNQLSFMIKTYNMSTLMASKIAAIFQRGTRGVGEARYEEKGRDIYDLLWYMGKKITPDLDYLAAKDINISDLRILFDKLTLRMNKVNDDNLRQDLTPLFAEQDFIANWLKNWRESYFRLLREYKINIVTTLNKVRIFQDFRTDNFSFAYQYNTESEGMAQIVYVVSDYWILFRDCDLSIEIDKKLDDKIEFTPNGASSRSASRDKLRRYATLFYQKTEAYFKKTNRVMLGDIITTKIIRMTADNLNQKEQIVLDKSALLSCELEDLLK